jgi:chromosome segregation ATPase
MGANGASLREQLRPMLDAQAKVADLDAKNDAIGDRLDKLDTEEQRQRANIAALKDADKSAQKRFVDQLGKIEDQILDLQKQQEALATQLDAANADLANKVQAVQFSQTLEP